MSKRMHNALLRVVACTVCLFLVGASLDAIPDPPAVTQYAQHSLASQVVQSGAAPANIGDSFRVSFFQPRDRAFWSGYVSAATLPAHAFVLVSYATDTSPPRFS
jgi:hypothetical protein